MWCHCSAAQHEKKDNNSVSKMLESYAFLIGCGAVLAILIVYKICQQGKSNTYTLILEDRRNKSRRNISQA